MPARPLIASHRGGSYIWPENSPTAFRETAKLAVDQVEFDVHLSADDACVVVHDALLDRTTEARGPVRARTLAELRAIRIRGAHGETIPTLAEVAAIFRGTPVRLRLDIKADAERRLYPGIAPRVLAVLAEAGMLDGTVITAFQAETITALREAGFTGEAIWLCALPTWHDIGLKGALGVARGRGAQGLGLHHSILDTGVLEAVRGAGLSPGAWGLKEREDIRRVLELGVDVFTSDDPVTALAMRG
ncbi:glycerophosphodiester phosphodiesterase [Pararoseomonas indoligenes]|uniref:Glycerophosphodiester phosphodiesterase n=1 Tax=Roseomonas indoligenes TaxID=2820811 RepID=A0A940MUR5_9PROT|nr:glycerophosphodiester phosphodiesterase [Pararoseomonas indoligenes]